MMTMTDLRGVTVISLERDTLQKAKHVSVIDRKIRRDHGAWGINHSETTTQNKTDQPAL